MRWVCNGWIRVGHADFMLLMSISFALSDQRERGFWWNMGFTLESKSYGNVDIGAVTQDGAINDNVENTII